MSFAEGISTVSLDLADPTLALCITSVVILIAMMAAVPALATTLRFLQFDRGLGEAVRRWITSLRRARKS